MADSPSLANNTIKLSVIPKERHEEGIVMTGETIYPGMFVRLDSSSGPSADKYSPGIASGVSSFPEKLVAVENPYWGKSVTDAYEENERLMFCSLRPGDYVLTKVTDLTDSAGSLIPGLPLTIDSGNYGWLAAYSHTKFLAGTLGAPVAFSVEYEPSPPLPRWTRIRIL